MSEGLSFGDKLRALRSEARKTQIEMALDLSETDTPLSQAAISALEQRATPPRTSIVQALTSYFGVGRDYFEKPVQSLERPKNYLSSLSQREIDRSVDIESAGFGFRMWQPAEPGDGTE